MTIQTEDIPVGSVLRDTGRLTRALWPAGLLLSAAAVVEASPASSPALVELAFRFPWLATLLHAVVHALMHALVLAQTLAAVDTAGRPGPVLSTGAWSAAVRAWPRTVVIVVLTSLPAFALSAVLGLTFSYSKRGLAALFSSMLITGPLIKIVDLVLELALLLAPALLVIERATLTDALRSAPRLAWRMRSSLLLCVCLLWALESTLRLSTTSLLYTLAGRPHTRPFTALLSALTAPAELPRLLLGAVLLARLRMKPGADAPPDDATTAHGGAVSAKPSVQPWP